ncbi:MAG: hypothetical protein H0U73_09450 [Tatlockia sp.]|nr:hypothetical protein [Tatlockia sp.]
MIAQVWQPLLYVMFIFVGCNKIPLSDGQKRRTMISLLSLISALTLTVAIDYNHNLSHVF